ncbi:MAG TPA: glycoside hydrolase family 3 N-terminal domain-containing protein, partial [Adhaeribacter sp.]|nr:glycoside hydrolase family 3 N-terminal domain-containing protein [Adhaeribacter sp.]
MLRFLITRLLPGLLFLAFLLFLILSGAFPGCETQKGPPPPPKKKAYYPKTDLQLQQGSIMEALNTESRWVDSVFETLTPDERIAQLMIVEGYSNQGRKYERDLLMLVKKYKVGGIIYFQGGPVRQARLTNRLQAASKVPLLLSMDAESGVGMRLDSTVQYPLPMLLGAARNDTFAYMLGAEIAHEFKRLGMHVNFAPVADINNNPANPVISYRAFGENKELVRNKSVAYMKGMQDNGTIAVGKHFPGHGDTDVDSHFDLPIVPFTRKRLDSLELDPFRALIKEGVGGIMVAHMHIPMLDDARNVPATLSYAITTKLLQHDMGYKGLVFTDAMVMKGVTKYFPPGVAELKALEAGNDIIERIASVPIALKVIRNAIKRGEISQTEIDRRCKKVLRAKLWVGLNKLQPIDTKNLVADLRPAGADSLNKLLAEASVTLLRNQNNVLPLNQTALRKAKKRVATLSFGVSKPSVFQQIAREQMQAPAFTAARKGKAANLRRIRTALRKYDLVIISIHGPSIRPSNNLGYGKPETDLINELSASGKAIVCFFDNAYALSQFEELKNARGLVLG